MRMQFHRSLSVALSALLFAASLATAQEAPPLRIGRPTSAVKRNTRTAPAAELDRDSAFRRVLPIATPQPATKSLRSNRAGTKRVSRFGETLQAAVVQQALSFGVGGGDINEIEPNDTIAQNVSLPVNVFGEIRFNGDDDFFAFQALAGEQITVEPFAARLPRSTLIADIALFASTGELLASAVGDENNDPLIRFVSPSDQVLIVGLTDADDLGGRRFDYLLNITRGVDVEEQEPNDLIAQQLPDLPITTFAEIGRRGDVDFYSFVGTAGQRLIVDVDAEALGSGLDAEINLTDPASGIEYFFNDQYDGDDPRFNIVLPLTGRYVIGVGAFSNNSTGFYRLNGSLVPSTDAPVLATVTTLAKKLIEVTGAGFTDRSVVEVNGIARRTTFLGSGRLQAKVKSKQGNVVTVSNLPDDQRSNPLVVQ